MLRKTIYDILLSIFFMILFIDTVSVFTNCGKLVLNVKKKNDSEKFILAILENKTVQNIPTKEELGKFLKEKALEDLKLGGISNSYFFTDAFFTYVESTHSFTVGSAMSGTKILFQKKINTIIAFFGDSFIYLYLNYILEEKTKELPQCNTQTGAISKNDYKNIINIVDIKLNYLEPKTKNKKYNEFIDMDVKNFDKIMNIKHFDSLEITNLYKNLTCGEQIVEPEVNIFKMLKRILDIFLNPVCAKTAIFFALVSIQLTISSSPFYLVPLPVILITLLQDMNQILGLIGLFLWLSLVFEFYTKINSK